MDNVRVGFNGMGRIGKNVMRVILAKLDDRFEIVAGNDLVTAADIAASLPHDSVYGRYPAAVELVDETTIQVGRHRVALYSEKDASQVPWGEHAVDIVFECTGFYLSSDKASAHLTAGAKRVIVSAPCSDDTATVVVGVNHDTIGAGQRIVSNASCTTNCLAPLTKAVDMSYPVQAGLMSTTHAATATQNVADTFGGGKHRATTGAAIAIGKVLPHLNGKLDGTALRVPTDTGSLVEAVYLVDGTPSKEEVLRALITNAAQINESSMFGQVMVVGDYYECSRDCVGEPFSSMVSDNILVVPTGSQSLIKATSFYDNEMGFSHRMVELALILAAD